MKCVDCDYKKLEKGNGSPNRYYCTNPDARFARSKCEPTPLICKTERHSVELTIKKAPKWCPLNKKKPED